MELLLKQRASRGNRNYSKLRVKKLRVQKIGLTSMPGGIARTRFEFSPKSVRIIFKFYVDVFGLSPYEYVGGTHFQEGLKFG